MTQQAASSVTPTSNSTIDADVPCVSCGYNLRGLDEDGRCPECATPIANSLRGSMLSCCDPTWIRRLGLGAILTLFGIIVALGTAVLTFFLLGGSVPAAITFLLWHAVATLLMAIGGWLLTAPEAREDADAPPARTRRRCRAVLLVALVEDALIAVVVLSHQSGVDLLVVVRVLTAVGWVTLLTHHLWHLSKRTDSEDFQHACRHNKINLAILSVSLGIGGVCLLISFTASVLDWAGIMESGPGFLPPVMGPFIVYCQVSIPLLGLSLLVLTLLMLGSCDRVMGSAALVAEQNWSGRNSVVEESCG